MGRRRKFRFFWWSRRKLLSLIVILCGGSGLYSITDIGNFDTMAKKFKTMFEEYSTNVDTEELGDNGVLDSYESARMLTMPKDGIVIRHTGYTALFSADNGVPYWVAWKLSGDRTEGNVRRCDSFFPDPAIPEDYRVEPSDYSASEYDRGHMCPAADNRWSTVAMNESFYMTNICPQNHDLNEKSWERLEAACRRWAKRWGEVYICCGPILKGHFHDTIGENHTVSVPEGFFKAVICLKKGKEKGIGFFYYNMPGTQTMENAALPISEIEKIADMDLFFNVPRQIQERIESTCNLREWDR